MKTSQNFIDSGERKNQTIKIHNFGICFQVPFLFGVSSFEKVAGLVIHWIFKRTGRHLFLKDEEEGKPPLLRRMVEDTGDCHFMYANALYALPPHLSQAISSLNHVWESLLTQHVFPLLQVCTACLQKAGGLFKCGP